MLVETILQKGMCTIFLIPFFLKYPNVPKEDLLLLRCRENIKLC